MFDSTFHFVGRCFRGFASLTPLRHLCAHHAVHMRAFGVAGNNFHDVWIRYQLELWWNVIFFRQLLWLGLFVSIIGCCLAVENTDESANDVLKQPKPVVLPEQSSAAPPHNASAILSGVAFSSVASVCIVAICGTGFLHCYLPFVMTCRHSIDLCCWNVSQWRIIYIDNPGSKHVSFSALYLLLSSRLPS